MFSRGQSQLLIVLLVLSLAFQLGPLIVLALLLLLSAAVAWGWQRFALANLSYTRTLSRHHAFPDDTVEFTIQVVNRKPLPLTSLRVQETVAAALDWGNTPLQYHEKPSQRILERTSSLRWYESLRWRYQVRCPQRGAFTFGPALLEAGDPFGFTLQRAEVASSIELVVYPRLLSLAELGLTARQPLGEVRRRQWLFADPTRTIGARDYRRDDPQKSIHWAATARRGQLQTRVYEPTTSLELLIFLDLDTFTHYWEGTDPEQVERAISAAATLTQEGLAERFIVGLIVNGMQAGHDGVIRLPPSRSPAQLDQIFDALARLVPYSVLPMASLLRQEALALPWGATVLLISAIAPEPLRASLMRVRERGHPTTWLYLGDERPPAVPGVHIQHAPPQSAFQRPAATRLVVSGVEG
jgi:uncharacterized protein (DUF58 family)